jgi:hypothetical protein
MTKHARARRSTWTAHAATAPRQTHREQTQAIALLTQGRPTVYALRMPDGVIKIGCSSDLARRRQRLGLDSEILGFMHGDFETEAAIHSQLRPYRARGQEYYHPVPAVLAVVNEMRDQFNLPHLTS